MKRHAGFTLIELMIVLVIVAILATIAYPSYARVIVKGNRGEAQSALQQIQLLQENHRRTADGYADNAALQGALDALEKADLYEYEITAASVTGYTVVARPIGRQAAREASLFGDTCATLTLVVGLGGTTRGPDEACWR